MRALPRVATGATAALLIAALGVGCGSADQPATTTVVVVKEVVRESDQKRKPVRRVRPVEESPRFVACDPNITVRADTTTCEFAQNVFYEYWDAGGAARVDAYSPAAGTMFPTRCRGSYARVVCTTADRGVVRFPRSAVAAYSTTQAADYAASADLGPGRRTTEPEAPEPPDDGGGAACDPNYEGACLDPSAYDYDCEGGSGDGPEYTGAVTVVGDDHFDLDSDGDGVACEW